MPLKNLIAVSAAVLVLSGCSTLQLSQPTTGGASQENAAEKPIHTEQLLIRKGEPLLSVATRLVRAGGYTGYIFDINGEENSTATRSRKIAVTGTYNSGAIDLSTAYEVPNLKAIAAKYNDKPYLVITTAAYEKWQQFEIFYVEAGTLKKNATQLAYHFGWALPDSEWTAENFTTTSYPLVISEDPREAFSKLFAPYPLIAQLNPNNLTVTVVPSPYQIRETN